MLRQLRDRVLLKALLALLVCAYALPGAASLCVSASGHSLGYDCGCSDCQPLQDEPGSACQMACCLEAEQLRDSMALQHGPQPCQDAEGHSGKCCTHHKFHAVSADLQAELPLIAAACIYEVPAVQNALQNLPQPLLLVTGARGSPPPQLTAELQLVSSTQLRL